MEREFSRRSFLKTGAIALGTVAVSGLIDIGSAVAAPRNKTEVFFTEDISAKGLLKIYCKIN